MKATVTILCITILFSCAQSTKDRLFEEKVTTALKQQMARYPQSTLRDIYKNFFQDKFGPGHLLSDTAAAGQYLCRELNSYNPDTLPFLSPYVDSTGWELRFFRVDLRVIKEGKVSYRDFFEAFVRSAQAAPVISVEEWTKEWTRIVAVLEKQPYSVIHQPDYKADKDSIIAMLLRGEYVGHHSRIYVASYAPHYRLITADELQSLEL
ncbi:MAG: hypothetical protein WC128_05935 [Bacteroidales bacterium]|jgi:hypothetical protein